jgi:regulator of sigma E protease
MGDTPVALFEDMRPSLNAGAGQTFRFQVERAGQVLGLSARLDAKQDGGRTIGLLGIYSTAVTRVVLSPTASIVRATGKTWETIHDTIAGITLAITRGQGTENFAGVVGIAQLAGDAAGQGIATLLALVAILSANLALMNLLPIPVLDGGELLFCLAEVALRRPLSPRIQAAATGLGFVALAMMFLLTTVHDLDGLGVLRWLTQL